jgi:hypothetical protein
MDPDVLRYKCIAESLSGRRMAAIAKYVDITLEDSGKFPQDGTARLDETAWKEFGAMVWAAEPSVEPLNMTLLADLGQGIFCGTARWEKDVAVIECSGEGLTRRTTLHEIAHLIADRDYGAGHRWNWAREFSRLIQRWIGEQAAADWNDAWFDALDTADGNSTWPVE